MAADILGWLTQLMGCLKCLFSGAVGRTIWPAFVCVLISAAPVAMAVETEGRAACANEQLRYINSDIFDASIESRVINSCPSIEVLTALNMTLEDISPRLDRWLVRIVNGGGKVRIRPDAEREVSRAVSFAVLDTLASMAWGSYQAYRASKREKALAEAAAQYDATVFVDESSSRIAAVVLSRREP